MDDLIQDIVSDILSDRGVHSVLMVLTNPQPTVIEEEAVQHTLVTGIKRGLNQRHGHQPTVTG